MLFLKQSTAVTVKIGPFLDDTDGVTAETGLTISQADVRLSKAGGNMAQKNNATSCTHDEIGVYDCPLSTTDTNTVGPLQLYVAESGALPVWHEFMVLPANVYDSLVGGTDNLQTDVTQISGDSTAADNLESYCDGTTPQPVNATQVEGSDATDQIRDAVVDDATRIDASALNTLSGHDPGETIAGVSDPLTAAEVNAEVVDVMRTDTIPDSYASDGSQPTMAQALLGILQFLTEKSVSSTTVTVKKPDGSTTAMTFTLDDGTTPTSITRAS